MTAAGTRRRGHQTPDSHDYPTRSYDLVKEFMIALAVMTGAVARPRRRSSPRPDDKAITMSSWAKADPADVVATAAGELAGTTTSATYGAPYNHASEGQSVLGLKLQKWGGVGIPVNSADLVLQPLRDVVPTTRTCSRRSPQWDALSPDQQTAAATAYADALAKAPSGQTRRRSAPAATGRCRSWPWPSSAWRSPAGSRARSPRPAPSTAATRPAACCCCPTAPTSRTPAVADQLGGDQWGMMNEVGNYPGQPWMWLYTFWYQVKPFSTSENADAQVWALMMGLTLLLLCLPWIPGLRDIPRWIPVHRLIWREHYRRRTG